MKKSICFAIVSIVLSLEAQQNIMQSQPASLSPGRSSPQRGYTPPPMERNEHQPYTEENARMDEHTDRYYPQMREENRYMITPKTKQDYHYEDQMPE